MSWMQKLYETYEANTEEVGVMPQNNKPPLLPIYHATQQAQIEAVIDMDGNWCCGKGRVITDKADMTTIIPCTEKSGNRTSAPEPHPLFDKLQYLAGDYVKYGEAKKYSFDAYLELLSAWCDSPYGMPQLKAVRAYLQKKRLIQDLADDGLLYRDEAGAFPAKWTGEKEDTPPIFKAVTNGQLDAFVRFRVHGIQPEEALWKDKEIWQSWIAFENSMQGEQDVCYVLGENAPVSELSPRKIRNPGDGAKLISSNDTSGFTFRGRFDTAREALRVGRETSEKAHNALRWLIGRQGYVNDSQVVLAWAIKTPLPQKLICGNASVANKELQAMFGVPPKPVCTNGEVFAREFKKALKGYRGNLAQGESVAVIGLDSATPGRLSVFYYRELRAVDLLDRVAHWHNTCSWLHTYYKTEQGKDKKGKAIYVTAPFIGAPAPQEIVEAAYGQGVDAKLKRSAVERLLPCIIDQAAIPKDLMYSVVRRATNAVALEPWEANKTQSIACALVHKYYNDKKNREREDYTGDPSDYQEVWKMALDETCNDRSYLFGRALACAQRLEEATYSFSSKEKGTGNEEKRTTNAVRMQAAFVRHPAKIWRQLEQKLIPYRLRYKNGCTYDSLLTEIIPRIAEFDNKPLSPLYILGYRSQLLEFRKKSSDDLKD